MGKKRRDKNKKVVADGDDGGVSGRAVRMLKMMEVVMMTVMSEVTPSRDTQCTLIC